MGFASLWIFYFHVGPVLFSESKIAFLKNCEWYINSLGYCGVEIFLLLSGMGLVYAIHKQNLLQFYIRRFLRIYPSFWIWFTISTLVRNDSMTWMDYLGRITFYSNWTEDLLAYKWYVAVILMLYLWFPLYYFFLRNVKYPTIFTALLIVAEFCLTSILYDYIRSDLFLFLNRIPIFLMGVLAGHYCVEYEKNKIMQNKLSLKGWSVLDVVLVGAIICSFCLHKKTEIRGWGDNFRSILNTVIATELCLIWPRIFDLLENSKMIRIMRGGLRSLGSISLEFYLTHELIALKVKSYDLHFVPSYKVNQIIIVFLCFAAAYFAAWVLWKMTDKLSEILRTKCINVNR